MCVPTQVHSGAGEGTPAALTSLRLEMRGGLSCLAPRGTAAVWGRKRRADSHLIQKKVRVAQEQLSYTLMFYSEDVPCVCQNCPLTAFGGALRLEGKESAESCARAGFSPNKRS